MVRRNLVFWHVSCLSSWFAQYTKFKNSEPPPPPLIMAHYSRGVKLKFPNTTPLRFLRDFENIWEISCWKCITWPHEGICEKYEEICQNYERIWRNTSIYWILHRPYRLRDLEKFLAFPLYMEQGTWKNSELALSTWALGLGKIQSAAVI